MCRVPEKSYLAEVVLYRDWYVLIGVPKISRAQKYVVVIVVHRITAKIFQNTTRHAVELLLALIAMGKGKQVAIFVLEKGVKVLSSTVVMRFHRPTITVLQSQSMETMCYNTINKMKFDL